MPLSLHMLDPLKAARRGYAVVIQDTRGTLYVQYNPIDPVPTRGGPLCCNAYGMAGGVYDQQKIERRQDVEDAG